MIATRTEYVRPPIDRSLDHRFKHKAEILTQKAIKDLIMHSLDGVVEKTITRQHFIKSLLAEAERFSLFFLDLDGFKKINELFSHQAGDIILERIVDAIIGVQSRLADDGFQVTLYNVGGDEFGLFLEYQEAIPLSKEKEIASIARRAIAGIETADVLNFASQEIRRKCRSQGIDIPRNFRYEASASIGYCNLGRALLFAAENGLEEKLGVAEQRGKNAYKRFLEIIMGELLDVADTFSEKEKARHLRMMLASSDPHKVALGQLKDSRQEQTVKKITKEKERLRTEIAGLQSQLALLQQRIGAICDSSASALEACAMRGGNGKPPIEILSLITGNLLEIQVYVNDH